MPIYKVGDKKYNVPQEELEGFLAEFPQAEEFTEGKTSTTEPDTTVDATEVSAGMDLALDFGSSELPKTKSSKEQSTIIESTIDEDEKDLIKRNFNSIQYDIDESLSDRAIKKDEAKIGRFKKGNFKTAEKEEYQQFKETGKISSYVYKEEEIDQLVSNAQRDFMEDLSTEDRQAMLSDEMGYIKPIQERRNKTLNKIYDNKLAVETIIKDYNIAQESGTPYSEEERLAAVKKVEEISNSMQLMYDAVNKDNSLLDDEKEFIDSFKRSYSNVDQLTNITKAVATDMALGVAVTLDILTAKEGEKSSLRNNLAEYREELQVISDTKLPKPIPVSSISNVSDFLNWGTDGLVNFVPSGIMAFSGPAAMPLFFASGYGGRMSEFELEERKAEKSIPLLEKQLSETTDPTEIAKIQEEINRQNEVLTTTDLSKLLVSTIYGTSEVVTEKLTTLRLVDDLKSANTVFQTDGFGKALVQKIKEIPTGPALEGGGEGVNALVGNFADIYIVGADKSLFDGVDEAAAQGALIGTGFKVSETGMLGKAAALDVISDRSEKKKLEDIRNDITLLTSQLDKESDPNKRFEILGTIRNKVKETVLEQDFTATQFLKLSEKEQQEVFESDRKARKVNKRWARVAGSNIDEKAKEVIRKDLEAEYNSYQDNKTVVLRKSSSDLKELAKVEGLKSGDFNRNYKIYTVNDGAVKRNNKLRNFANKIIGVTESEIEKIQDFVSSEETSITLLDKSVLNKEDAAEVLETWNNGATGGFSPSTKNIYSFVERSASGNPSTVLHEYFHAMALSKGFTKEQYEALRGDYIIMLSAKVEDGSIAESQREDILARYLQEYDGSVENAEELINLTADAVNLDILKQDDVTFLQKFATNVKSIIGTILSKEEADNYSIDTAEDAWNMVQTFSQDVLSKRKGPTVVSSGEPVESQDGKIKESRPEEASARVQELYDTQGEAAAFDIIEQFKPITSKIVEKRSEAPGFDRQLLTDEIETGKRGILDLVREYDPESGVPLAAYINKFLPARAIEASRRILGEEFTEDVTEAKGVAAEEASIEVAKTEKQATSKLRRVLGIKQGDAIYDLAKEVSGEILSGDLPGKKVKTAINREARKSKLRKAVSDLMGTEKAIDEQFLNKNILEILKALPASDLVKLERESKAKVLAEQGPRLNVKDAREAVNKGLLPKDTNLQSGPKVSSKLPTTLEQAKEFFTQKRKASLVNVVTEMLVKDAAPEVTEGKMEPAKRAKVLSEIDREPTLKFSISEASQAKNINDAGKLAGIKGKITINDGNRAVRQSEILNSIIEGNIPTVIFEAGRFGNFGRWNRRGKIVNGKFIPIPKIGTKYFKTKNGTLIKENSKEYKKATEDGNFLPGRGGLYYGVKDPAYIEARNAAKKNDKLYSNLKKPKRVNMINAFTEAGQAQSKANMDTLETMANVLAKAVADGTMTKENAALFIASSYQATTGLIKIAAPFKYRSKIFEYGLSGKQRQGDKYREEHNPPASVIGSNLIWAIANNKVSEIMPSIRKNFNQTQLSKKDDEKIDNAKLDATLPIGTTILDNPVTRIAASGINLNSIVNVETGKTLAEENGVGVETKFENNLEVYTKQNELVLRLNSDKNFTVSQAKKQIDQFVKIAPSIVKASKSNNDKSAFKYSETPTNKVTIDTAARTDKALDNARDLNAPVKKIRVFDFDDTLAQTKSDVLYTMPDGTEGKLNAEQFARDGGTLLSEGAVFDFSEFNKVTEGKKGPLFKVAQTIAAKRGTEDVFVLTARAPESQLAIYEFLKSQGLNIPLKNITGLGDSTGDAKARWIVDKAADGYNDFYFADDAFQNVKAVKDALSVLDVKSKTQQAKIKFSKSLDLNKDFNDIIENKTGIASDKTYARVKAEVAGANKGKFNFFIPPSAEDFVGLLYSTLGKGDVGDAQMAWYKAHLLNPFARAMENIANDRVAMIQDYKGLKKALKIVPKDLRKKVPGEPFTREQAVRVYVWDQQGMEIPGLSKKDQSDLVKYVDDSAELTTFADQLIAINKGDEYASPDAGWIAGTIDTDFLKALNTTKRAKYLEVWQQNVDEIFSETNLNKLEAAYGKPYRVAMENILHRMKTGRNRSFGTDTITGRFTDWLTNSVGAIMFFNTRSAVLQTISAVNFINFSDNNVLRAGQAFANQPQYWSDFKKLFNSPFLLDRRSGIKLNVNEADIAEMAKGPGNSARNVIAGLLKAGFLPTQLADSFAIASGGATFYRNRIKALKKEGLTEAEAEEIAFRDFREIAEESQQSSRPDKISQQQAGPLGRVVLAFANTPAQYARLIKKAASDLKNGRGDAKTNISKIIYYGVAQNVLFSALQQALFAVSFGDDEEEEKKRDEKYFNIANGMADSILRGIGVGGAIASVVKNTAIKLAKEEEKRSPKYQDVLVKEVLQISPPISSKVGKLRSAGRSLSWNKKEMMTKGWSIDNPAYLASANVISAVTNLPADRAVKKITNLVDASNEEIEYYKRIALALGWSSWELGIDKKDKKKPESSTGKTRTRKRTRTKKRRN